MNFHCDKTKKNQIVTNPKLKFLQLKNINCDNSKTQIVTKHKLRNIKKKLKLSLNSKTQIVTKLKNSKCDRAPLNIW